MDISGWVTDRFGSTDTGTLLDESIYSTTELRKDKHKLERKLSQLESDLDEHETRYKHFLHKGAKADDIKKSQLAQKARFEKKKFEVTKKQYKQVSIKLGTVISIEGMREITSMGDDQQFNIDDHIDAEFDSAELQAELMDQMAEFGLEVEDMQAVQDALDVEILDEQLDMEASEEMELMEEMAADNLSSEQITLDEETELEEQAPESDTNGDQAEFDIEADIEDEKLDLDSI